jgi:hypothetical protein
LGNFPRVTSWEVEELRFELWHSSSTYSVMSSLMVVHIKHMHEVGNRPKEKLRFSASRDRLGD